MVWVVWVVRVVRVVGVVGVVGCVVGRGCVRGGCARCQVPNNTCPPHHHHHPPHRCLSRRHCFIPQITIHTAVCDKQRTVHYVDEGMACCRGIAEFMSRGFLERRHPQVAAQGFGGEAVLLLPACQCRCFIVCATPPHPPFLLTVACMGWQTRHTDSSLYVRCVQSCSVPVPTHV